jgi:hypothetical protein
MLIKETTMTSVTVSGTNGRKKDTISIQINSFNPNQSNKVNDFEIINGEIV